MKHFFVIMSLMLYIPVNAQAYDKKSGFTTYIYDNWVTCSGFINDMRRNGVEENAKAWMNGVMTAVNMFAHGKRDFFDKLDGNKDLHSEKAYWMIGDWCMKNPHRPFVHGLIEFLRFMDVKMP